MSRQKWVIGNWKLNGSLANNARLIEDVLNQLRDIQTQAKVGVCPPFPYLAQLQTLLQKQAILLGAQNAAEQTKGAYTGEVACDMLKEFGCELVILGHSERRALFSEDDALVGRKVKTALQAGLRPVICVGETEAERESQQTETVLARQLDAVLAANELSSLHNTILAYEPVWAIGTGKTATPEIAQAAHAFLRQRLAQRDAQLALNISILYGGSVKAANARELFAMPDIDGGLIGSAALNAEEFVGICKAA